MKFYLFTHPDLLSTKEREKIRQTISVIEQGTNTNNLVTGLYLSNHVIRYQGTAYVQNWMTPKQFHPRRGKWTFVQKWPVPDDLPAQFKLIRLHMEWNPKKYPKLERDIYHWEFQYPAFKDHLANLFAHELHHFRRHHLGMHPKEGEQAANRWALEHVKNLGFQVTGKKLKIKRIRKQITLLESLFHVDPFSDFRELKAGQSVRIIRDSRKQYQNQTATIVRPIRKNSKRMVIQTSDGKIWRWPMNWLQILDKPPA